MSHIDTTTTGAKYRIIRAWGRLAPKLIVFLTTGLSATILISAADAFGFELEPGLAAVIVTVVSTVAGYFKADTVRSGELSVE